MQLTRWNVITGAPSSGKTAVIEQLARRGYRVVPEVARRLIARGLAGGRTLAQIKSDILAFEQAILIEKVRIESKMPVDEVVFFDRAVPDSVAYFELEGLDPGLARAECGRVRYRRIFLFERLPYLEDPVRTENDAVADAIEDLLVEIYRDLGYPVLRVPVLTVTARMEWILGKI